MGSEYNLKVQMVDGRSGGYTRMTETKLTKVGKTADLVNMGGGNTRSNKLHSC